MMKKLSLLGLVFGLAISLIGCDAAKEKMDDAKDAGAKVAGDMKDAAGDMKDAALDGINFGDFDMKGMQGKLSGITDGFKNVTADTADGLSTKISDLTSSIGDMGIGDLTGVAKTAVTGAISKFTDAINAALEKISDEGVMGKLKPAVEALVEKLNTFK